MAIIASSGLPADMPKLNELVVLAVDDEEYARVLVAGGSCVTAAPRCGPRARRRRRFGSSATNGGTC